MTPFRRSRRWVKRPIVAPGRCSGPPAYPGTRRIGQAWGMAEKLTLMAVHAHPDDESSSTGGVLATYSGQGIRTVVVTCTNGEFGDAPGGVKPGEDGHDEQAVAELRLSELRQACKILGVTDLETLGYHDSGMPDWDYKDRPEAFCNIPLAEVTQRVSGLIEEYRPQVVVSYDPEGPYQHPDHVHAARGWPTGGRRVDPAPRPRPAPPGPATARSTAPPPGRPRSAAPRR